MSRTRAAYQDYFRHLADLLALKDWRIEVIEEAPVNEHAMAFIECVYGRKWCQIRLSDRWLADPEDRQRQHAAHELIHAHLSAADQIADNQLPRAARPAYRLLSEFGVDGLADGIAPLLPLPSDVLGSPLEFPQPDENSPLLAVDRSA